MALEVPCTMVPFNTPEPGIEVSGADLQRVLTLGGLRHWGRLSFEAFLRAPSNATSTVGIVSLRIGSNVVSIKRPLLRFQLGGVHGAYRCQFEELIDELYIDAAHRTSGAAGYFEKLFLHIRLRGAP